MDVTRENDGFRLSGRRSFASNVSDAGRDDARGTADPSQCVERSHRLGRKDPVGGAFIGGYRVAMSCDSLGGGPLAVAATSHAAWAMMRLCGPISGTWFRNRQPASGSHCCTSATL